MSYIHVSLCILLIITSLSSCTKDIKDVSEGMSPGLDTIPFYQKGSSAFDTKAAMKALDEEKKVEEQKKASFIEEMKQKSNELQEHGLLFDPWIPPATRKPADMPLALRDFPKDKFGYPDWVAAVKQGLLGPRPSLEEDVVEEPPAFNEDILFEINDRLMNNVIFPHSVHNFWLSCKVCHPGIFIPKRGANDFSMYDNWKGRYCGRCHGKVSFQMKGFENCQRCHRSKKKTMGPQ